MHKLLKFFIDNQLLLLLAVSVVCGTILTIIRMVIVNNASVDLYKSGLHFGKPPLPPDGVEKRDNSYYRYFTEKVDDLRQEIYEIHEKLADKQFEVFVNNFKRIYKVIIDSYVVGYRKWCEEGNHIMPEYFENSRPYLRYCLIIKEITQDNFANIHNYVKDNDLWQYTEKEWIKYKKTNANKYMDMAREKFSLMYSKEACDVPVYWHSSNIMRPTEKIIREIVDDIQEELRCTSLKYHEMSIEKGALLLSYKSFQEPVIES